MSQILIPEIKILEIIETALKVVEVDFNGTVDETQTILYRVFGGNQIGKFNFYEQAKEVFLRGNEHPRKIQTRMMFDAQRASLPTIHISMPSESHGSDGIGVDEGYEENFVDSQKGTVNKTYTRMFDAQYNCIITSDNSLEVLCVYHMVKAVLIGIFDNIEFQGIRNPKLSGQDLQLNSDLVPPHIFVRGVGINCSYEQSVPAIQTESFINSFQILYNIIP